ncbi:MAG: hypothetical protein ACE37N_02060 [Pseudohongiellaceae bacterium]
MTFLRRSAWQLLPALLLTLISTPGFTQSSEIRAIQDSVIKIYTTQAELFYALAAVTPRQSSGSSDCRQPDPHQCPRGSQRQRCTGPETQ